MGGAVLEVYLDCIGEKGGIDFRFKFVRDVRECKLGVFIFLCFVIDIVFIIFFLYFMIIVI